MRKSLLAAILIIVSVISFQTSARANELHFVKTEKSELPEKIIEICYRVAQKYDLPPELLIAIVERESGGKVHATGDGGKAIGLCQIHECYQHERMARLGITDLYDPESNITVAAEIIVELLDKYEHPALALMHYNGSSDADIRFQNGNYSDYAVCVMNRITQLQKGQ